MGRPWTGYMAAAMMVRFYVLNNFPDEYAATLDEVLADMASAVKAGDVERRLRGPVAHSGFVRLTG